jgi:pimeloyl-ACP methyl ester carboxylesterase
MRNPFKCLCCVVVLLISGCSAMQFAASPRPVLKQVQVPGATLTYLEQGTGEPVVFVHGAFADHRVWEGQREAISRQYHYIALDQRYFGASPWSDNGSNFSLSTHADDLAVFIEGLRIGKVHLVGHSYGGAVVLTMTARRPDLVRSLFVYEPALGSIVTDPETQKTLAEERKGLGPVVAASKAGDQATAVRLFSDWVETQEGGFDTLPQQTSQVLIENGRTLPLQFGAPPPPAVSCAQLAQTDVRASVGKGGQSRPYFTLLSDAAHRCMPGSQLIVIPSGRHMTLAKDRAAFNAAILTHLAGSR